MPAKLKSEAGARHWSPVTDYWPVTLSLVLAVLSSGCCIVRTAVDPGQTVRAVTPGRKDKPTVDPVEVQQMLLRFADEYSMRMIGGVDKLRRGTNVPSPAEVLQVKIALTTESCSIATGPNAVANLLDMTIFVAVTRMALEDYWQPKVFGETALPLLDYARSAETAIWQIANKVLNPAQQAELRKAIEEWHSQNPFPESLVPRRALGFTSQIAKASKDDTAGSVFSLLKVDPFAGMDPAVQEIAQTRLLAERALFLTRKMPMLLRWQTELLAVNSLEMPAVRQLVANSTALAASVERFASVAEKLPGQVSTEREEILKALQSQEKNLTPLVNEVHQTLTAGAQMSTSLNTTLITFDSLMKRFGVGETDKTNPPPTTTNTEPFRIQNYTVTASQLQSTARQLTELLVTFDRTIGSTNLLQLSGQISPVVQQAQTGGKEIVNYAFLKGILLVAVGLAAALIYRLFSARLTSAKRSQPNSPPPGSP